jgi:hypothetical protein
MTNDPSLTAENVVNTNVKDLATAPPPKPEPLTRAELGKLRRAHITQVQGTVRACGHKFDSKRQPRTNCQFCWEAYFFTAVDTAAIHDDFQKGGKAQLRKVYGDVFTKAFGLFLQDQLMKELENGQGTETGSSSGNQHIHSDQCSHEVSGEDSSGMDVPSTGI